MQSFLQSIVQTPAHQGVQVFMSKTKAMTGANPLATEKISHLIIRYSLPAIISGLVSAIYNMVDQIFLGWGVGDLGMAATNVAFPFTTICMAMALLFGIGGASKMSLSLGKGDKECSKKILPAIPSSCSS